MPPENTKVASLMLLSASQDKNPAPVEPGRFNGHLPHKAHGHAPQGCDAGGALLMGARGTAPAGLGPSGRPPAQREGAVGAGHGLYPDILPSMNIRRMSITGGGEEYPKCGTPKFLKCCEDPDHPKHIIPCNCGRPGCPVCWPLWAGRGADRVASMLEAYQDLIRSPYRPSHVSLSPDPNEYPNESEDAMQALLEASRKVSRALGVTAAAVIPHGYRIRREHKREASDGASRLHINRYEWCMQQQNPREYLYWSPHIHILGWGYLQDADAFHKRTGWIYKKHRNVDHIQKAVFYLLSHAWVPARVQQHVIRYWGGLAPTKLGCEKSVTWVEEICPVCKCPMHRIPLNQEGADQETSVQDVASSPIARTRVEVRRYWIRKGPP